MVQTVQLVLEIPPVAVLLVVDVPVVQLPQWCGRRCVLLCAGRASDPVTDISVECV